MEPDRSRGMMTTRGDILARPVTEAVGLQFHSLVAVLSLGKAERTCGTIFIFLGMFEIDADPWERMGKLRLWTPAKPLTDRPH